MPTFKSIRIHPDLHQRLVTESTPGKPQVIETPQALLSRNPALLRLLQEGGVTRPLALPVVENLRHEVAVALIDQLPVGKRARIIRKIIDRNVRPRAIETAGGSSDISRTKPDSLSFPGMINGLVLERHHEALQLSYKDSVVTSGCPSIDGWMIPGPRGFVSQISGPSGCGKTQWALQLLALSSSTSCSGHYWSSNPSLQPVAKRLVELGKRKGTTGHEHVQLSHISNEFDLLQRLDTIGEHPPGVLVVDNLSSCFVNVEYHHTKMQIQIARTLKSVARTYGIAVVLVNGAVTASQKETMEAEQTEDEDGDGSASRSRPSQFKPAMSWLRASDIRIWFEKCPAQEKDNNLVLQARLDRHPLRRIGQEDSVTLAVSSSGVTEIAPPLAIQDR